MTGLPTEFRLLDGDEAAAATEAWRAYSESLAPRHKHGGFAGRNDFTRLITSSAGFGSQGDHLDAVRAGAVAMGESIGWVVGDYAHEHGEGFAAMEIDLAALCEFNRTADFTAGKTVWRSVATEEWPEAAAGVAEAMVFSARWAMVSTQATWGYLSVDNDDFTSIAGKSDFLRAYRESRSGVVLEPIIWLQSAGHFMTTPSSVRRGVFKRRVAEDERVRSPFMRRYLESFYSRADADWIWNLFVELERDGFGQRPFEGWDKWIERLTARINERTGTLPRLTAIWDESSPTR